MRSHKSRKDNQYNGLKRKQDKRTTNDLQNTNMHIIFLEAIVLIKETKINKLKIYIE
jgi:hypothetical protein